MKHTILILLCFTFVRSLGQITLNLKPTDPNTFRIDQMFSVDVMNSGNAAEVVIIGIFSEESSGRDLVNATSIPITIKSGINTLFAQDLQPQYTYANGFNQSLPSLPFGKYRVCLQLINSVTRERLADGCSRFEVNPVSPPLLIYPVNASKVSDPFPVFTWLPPTPLIPNTYQYAIRVAEINDQQTPYDAVQRNFAVYYAEDLANPQITYPANAIKLEPGKKYAWNVLVYTDGTSWKQQTETWWFEIPVLDTPNTTSYPICKSYIIPNSRIDNSIVNIAKLLKVHMDNYPTDLPLKFELFDSKGKRMDVSKVQYTYDGSYQYSLSLEQLDMKHKEQYLFIVYAVDNGKKYIPFRHIKE